MSWYAVWRTADNQLVSTGTVVADPLPEGLTATVFDAPQVGVWNAQTKAFDPAPTVRVVVLSRLEFLQRLTVAERMAIREAAKTNPAIEDFLHMLNLADTVNLEHQTTQQGLGYLEKLGLLAVGRAAVILT